MDINCLVVDDEPPAIDELKYILSQLKGIDVVGTASSAGKAILAIRSKQPDLVFLDIKMPGRDGFDVIKACSSFQRVPYFVLATAYDQHAVKAFDASAVDYILKPFQPERVQESVERVRQLLVSKRQNVLCGQLEKIVQHFEPTSNGLSKITVENKGRLLLLDPDAIVLCRAENKDVWVHTDNKKFKLNGTNSLDKLESKLSNHNFFRTHRGFLVNLAYVKELAPWFNGKYILTIDDHASTDVPVSRRRVKALKTLLGL